MNKIIMMIIMIFLLTTITEAKIIDKKEQCTCKKMTVILQGIADNGLALPSESFGAPEPTETTGQTQKLGPSIGYVKTGVYKSSLHIGWNFQAKAEIEGDEKNCKENQYTKGTIEYAEQNGKYYRLKAHDAGNKEPNIVLARGNAGYGSKVWAPDYVEKPLNYCKAYAGECSRIKLKDKKKGIITWIDAPGVWATNDYSHYDNKMTIKTIVDATKKEGQCYCVIDFYSTAKKKKGKDYVTEQAVYIDGYKCEIQTDMTSSSKKNIRKNVVIEK